MEKNYKVWWISFENFEESAFITGLRHKLYKSPKPVKYTSYKQLNYTPKPGNYTIV